MHRRTGLPSLKRRLLAILLGTVAAVWLATAAFSYLDVRHEVAELLDAHLAQSASLLVAQSGEELVDDDLEHAPLLHRYSRRVAFQVWAHGKTLRLHSTNAPNSRFSAVEEGFSDVSVGKVRWRVFSSWDAAREHLIQVAEQSAAREEIAARVGANLLKPLVFALAGLGLLVYLAVASAMRPLAAIGREMAQRDPANLQPLPLSGCPREVAPLVEGLNGLFRRVAALLENERRFTADAAHELRTPVAALRMQAQVALGAEDVGARRHALENVVAGCDRAARLIEQLLVLARLDPARTATTLARCDLRPVSRDVVAQLAPAAFAKNVDIELKEGPPVFVEGDPQLLSVLIRNLVENAVRYSPPGAKVWVSAAPQSTAYGPRLAVVDTGPGVPAEALTQLGQRFYRVLGTGESGSGLGLSIAKRIADLHRASLRFQPAANHTGLLVEVLFPQMEDDHTRVAAQ